MAHSLFPTTLGTCEIAWNEIGLVYFRLPEGKEDKAQLKLAKQRRALADNTPRPHWIRRLVESVQRHLEGRPQDFTAVPLDWAEVSDFQKAVYYQAREIKAGETKSYGEIAKLVGLGSSSARAVGVAMATNPWPLIVPCHRVVSSRGKMTGYSAPGGVRTKTRLLVLEGVELLSE